MKALVAQMHRVVFPLTQPAVYGDVNASINA
jgi:hypothetical protein